MVCWSLIARRSDCALSMVAPSATSRRPRCEWLCQEVQRQGQRVLVLIWDNASWHVSKEVRSWLQQHNRSVLAAERSGKPGVRIIPCWLPVKSPWLNRIEPHWVHGKRAIVEPAPLLPAQEVIQRVCNYFGCDQVASLTQQAS